LPLLASLEERSTHGEFDCFLGANDGDGLEEDDLANKATRDVFVLFWETAALPVEEALSYFWK